jgi:apolipoprotein N-acyltransferase
VWGLGGLSLVLVALAGLLADLLSRRVSLGALLAGLGPAAVGVALALAVPAPASELGPRVLLVQPGIPQERKMASLDPRVLFDSSVALMRTGLDELERRGEPPPDLVAWGETMLHAPSSPSAGGTARSLRASRSPPSSAAGTSSTTGPRSSRRRAGCAARSPPGSVARGTRHGRRGRP